jgi:hypothetical protein
MERLSQAILILEDAFLVAVGLSVSFTRHSVVRWTEISIAPILLKDRGSGLTLSSLVQNS